MVPNPRRYCECIGEDVFNDMFCEPPADPEPSDCICAAIYAPVTCADGKDYSNDCFAGCFGQTQCSPKEEEGNGKDIDDEGRVPDNNNDQDAGERCICPKIFRPVTCENGVTYSN